MAGELLLLEPIMFMGVLPALNGTSLNYFDGIVIVWLIIGIFLGRKRGMTQEFFPTLKWLGIVILAGLFYAPFSPLILQNTSGAFSHLWSNITAYILIAFAVSLVFMWLKQAFGEKLTGSDSFGRAEYYLGMLAGLVRFACMMIVVCALMHSYVYTDAQLAEHEKIQRKNFEAVHLPSYISIQHAALKESLVGPWIEGHLNRVLIVSAMPVKPGESMAKKREDTINAIIGPAKN